MKEKQEQEERMREEGRRKKGEHTGRKKERDTPRNEERTRVVARGGRRGQAPRPELNQTFLVKLPLGP